MIISIFSYYGYRLLRPHGMTCVLKLKAKWRLVYTYIQTAAVLFPFSPINARKFGGMIPFSWTICQWAWCLLKRSKHTAVLVISSKIRARGQPGQNAAAKLHTTAAGVLPYDPAGSRCKPAGCIYADLAPPNIVLMTRGNQCTGE